MSFIEEETEDYLILRDYVHGNRESYSDWQIDEIGKPKYSKIINEAEYYALYEIKVLYRIDKKTGELKYLSFEA